MMKLKGKAKEDFEKWYLQNKCTIHTKREDLDEIEKMNFDFQVKEAIDWFFNLDFSMQYGVLVDWFDSVGITIVIEPYLDMCDMLLEWRYYWKVSENFTNDYHCEIETYSRNKARKASIEKGGEIYNSRV